MVKFITGWIRETRLNMNFEMFAFLAHRLTGLGITFYLLAHLYSLGHRMLSAESYNNTMLLYDKWFFHIGEWILFLMCTFHAFNGIRIMLVDFFPLTEGQKKLTFWVVGITAVLGALAALFFFEPLKEMVFISQ